MNLTPGTRLDNYEILELIGKGGMGEVYRAKDTRLPREVAIKVSAEKFTERFAREAKIIASLNHPNICTLFDIGPNYLVMEMVEGPTLTDRIKEGALSLDTASGIARQIADALDYAHEKTVVHRDLKPGNVKIRPDGVVKVLDFGLAKVGRPVSQSDQSPTLTIGETEAGMILGTAAYMAPEQALGKPVDKRADIWAFGVVFYEMLSGARLHKGDTMQETMTSVLRDEPDWSKVPAQSHRLIKRCLEKDPQKRLRHIGDVMSLLDDAPSSQQLIAAPPPPEPAQRKWLWPAVAVAGALAAGIAVWAPWRGPSNLQPIRFEILATEKMRFITGGNPALSPDGKWVVFAATGSDNVTRYWLRALDSVEVRPLPGTESPYGLPPPPFWSADSRFIAYSITGAPLTPGQLKKLDITGGAPQTICDVPAGVVGGTWKRDGTIVFANNNGVLSKVSAAGGMATPVTTLNASRKETGHRWPQFLPDGRHFLYHRASSVAEYTAIFVGSIDSKPEEQSLTPLLISDRQGVYAARAGEPGQLLFLRDTTLFAQAFDPGSLELSGDAVPVADQVGSFPPGFSGLFSVSETGVLAYRVGVGGNLQQLTWFDSQGKSTGTVGDKGAYSNPAVSPDGTRVAVSQLDPQKGNSNIWVVDISRGNSTRLTFSTGRDDYPVWSPDGKSIVFASNRAGHMDLYQKPSDGSGAEQLLLKSEEDKIPTSWSRDGRFLLYTDVDPKMRDDLWVLPLEGERKPVRFLQTEFREYRAQFSPDGHWVAYQSTESGNSEVYVRPFSANAVGEAASGGKWMVSKGGGGAPRWRADGKELFYLGQLVLNAVDVTTDKTFQAGVPRRLFALPPNNTPPDAAADGKRFLLAAPEGVNMPTPFTIVLNWQSAPKK